MSSRFYQSFEEFAREEIRPMSKVGWSLDDIDFEAEMQTEMFSFKDEDSDDEEE